ncbi:MAG: AAA family ATPase [Xanthomonadales bacterium]|nr:AAA family ATPase [Xanthomonadales bacterium]
MYQQYFGLSDPPFSITPDPRFVYLSERHEDALAHLRYGLTQGGGGGFVQLTGEVGTGKTTLCRCLLEDLPDHARAALILNPRLDPLELLWSICEELKVSIHGARASSKKLIDRLNRYLLKAHGEGLTVVLIIDEAQNLSPDALEQVRLLTNLETPTQKLLQIILLGQPELRDLLRRPDLRQLSQRITARYHLTPLAADETRAYVEHRLRVAGAVEPLFNGAGYRALHRYSDGIPRLINILAERSLIAAYARGSRRAGAALVRQAADEVLDQGHAPARWRYWPGLAAAALMLATLATGWYFRPAPPAAPRVVEQLSIAPDPGPAPATPVPGGDFQQAWDQLMDLHGHTAEPRAGSSCPQAMAPGVHCSQGRASLALLQTLGRPVIVEVSTGETRYGVVQVSESGVTLHAAEGPRQISRSALERVWEGRYWDVWSVPAYVPDTLREGDRGPGVLWIKAAAARAQPAYGASVDDPYFGPALRTWALEYQRSSGLTEDGLIGRDTLQRLSRLAPLADTGAG